jgi:hypothetical protein
VPTDGARCPVLGWMKAAPAFVEPGTGHRAPSLVVFVISTATGHSSDVIPTPIARATHRGPLAATLLSTSLRYRRTRLRRGESAISVNDIRRFMRDGHRELVILKFSHYSNFDADAYREMIGRTVDTIGRWL